MPVCVLCESETFDAIDGLYYCQNCGTQSQVSFYDLLWTKCQCNLRSLFHIPKIISTLCDDPDFCCITVFCTIFQFLDQLFKAWWSKRLERFQIKTAEPMLIIEIYIPSAVAFWTTIFFFQYSIPSMELFSKNSRDHKSPLNSSHDYFDSSEFYI